MRRIGFRARRVRCSAALIVALLVAGAISSPSGAAGTASPGPNPSLYTGPGSRPGPDILYQPLAAAPQLTNAGIWKAPSILVSGAAAYRSGELLRQDFLDDDHGTTQLPDPQDQRSTGNSFSRPAGTYTYPPTPLTPTTPPISSSSVSSHSPARRRSASPSTP